MTQMKYIVRNIFCASALVSMGIVLPNSAYCMEEPTTQNIIGNSSKTQGELVKEEPTTKYMGNDNRTRDDLIKEAYDAACRTVDFWNRMAGIGLTITHKDNMAIIDEYEATKNKIKNLSDEELKEYKQERPVPEAKDTPQIRYCPSRL